MWKSCHVTEFFFSSFLVRLIWFFLDIHSWPRTRPFYSILLCCICDYCMTNDLSKHEENCSLSYFIRSIFECNVHFLVLISFAVSAYVSLLLLTLHISLLLSDTSLFLVYFFFSPSSFSLLFIRPLLSFSPP